MKLLSVVKANATKAWAWLRQTARQTTNEITDNFCDGPCIDTAGQISLVAAVGASTLSRAEQAVMPGNPPSSSPRRGDFEEDRLVDIAVYATSSSPPLSNAAEAESSEIMAADENSFLTPVPGVRTILHNLREVMASVSESDVVRLLTAVLVAIIAFRELRRNRN